jgi:hypothetical protein
LRARRPVAGETTSEGRDGAERGLRACLLQSLTEPSSTAWSRRPRECRGASNRAAERTR